MAARSGKEFLERVGCYDREPCQTRVQAFLERS
jgi:hypothetical protein